jgi:hypothetical protein
MYKSIKILKAFDLFPSQIDLNINGKGIKKTVKGGIISIISIVFFFVIFFYLTFRFFNNRKPSIIFEKQYQKDMKPYLVDSKIFQMVMGLTDLSKNQKELKAQNNALIQNDINLKIGGENSFEVIGEYVNCDNIHNSSEILNEYVELYPETNDTYLVCLKSNLNNIFLGGSFTDSKRYYSIDSYIILDFCKIDNNCKNLSQLSENIYLYTILTYDKYFNMSDPLGYSIFVSSILGDIDLNRNIEIKAIMNINKIYRYSNFYNEELTEMSEFLSYENSQLSTIPKTDKNTNTTFIKISVELSSNINKYKLYYPKIDTLISSINGIFTVIFLCGKYITFLLNSGNLEYFMIKRLYYIRNERSNFKRIIKDKIKENLNNNTDFVDKNKLINNLSSGKVITFNLKDENFQKFIKGQTLKKGIFSYLISLIRFFPDKFKYNNYFFIGKKLLNHDLNLVLMIKKLIHLEVVMRILFNSNDIESIKAIHPRELYTTDNLDKTIKCSNNLFFYNEGNEKDNLLFSLDQLDYCKKKTKKILDLIVEF